MRKQLLLLLIFYKNLPFKSNEQKCNVFFRLVWDEDVIVYQSLVDFLYLNIQINNKTIETVATITTTTDNNKLKNLLTNSTLITISF